MSDNSEGEVPVHIYFLADRSGSMRRIRSDVVGGINTFVAVQSQTHGECRFTLVLFDDVDPQLVLHDAVPIGDVPEMADSDFIPRGTTPLLDAEGRLIARAEERARERQKAGLPAEAVLFATFTDGLENASVDWSFAQLSAKKKELADNGWTFTYLGVGHDAYSQASSVGTMSVNTVSAPADRDGVTQTLDSFTRAASSYRSTATSGSVPDPEVLYKNSPSGSDS